MEVTLAMLLNLLWFASILPILVASLPVSSFRPFREIIMEISKRGKTLQSSNKFVIHQKFFLHFYILAVIWTSFLLFCTWLYAYEMMKIPNVEGSYYSASSSYLMGSSQTARAHIDKNNVCKTVYLLLMMDFQVLRRLYESLNVFNYSSSAQMHICGYLVGIFFYAVAPLSLSSCVAPNVLIYIADRAPLFIAKGHVKYLEFNFNWWSCVIPVVKLGWSFWIGAAIFTWGWIHQKRCHNILGSLRDPMGKSNAYAIPYGDWFQFVSSPHYLAEIVIYFGFVIASGGLDITIWLLFWFVVANLVFAAKQTHDWYLSKFDNYPPSRYVILPFVY